MTSQKEFPSLPHLQLKLYRRQFKGGGNEVNSIHISCNNQIFGLKIITLKSEAGLNPQPLLNEDDQIPANPLADEK